MMKKTLAERMAEFAIGLKFEDLPSPVVHEVKRRVIDSLGCALGAWHADPCVAGRGVAATFSAERGATLWGTAHRSPPDWAAFVNGCMVRYFDYNDTYLSKEPAHPSDNIPAAIAVADADGASGRELIVAIALAYEIQCRLCDTSSIRARGWDHVTYGAFSSAIAAGRLMRLDAEHTCHAIGIAGVASAALRQSRVGELSHWKGCAFANAARHGVYAALLARAGITGPAPIFEGEKGFEKLVSGPLDDFRLLKEDFMIVKTSIKFWPAEYHSQSAIESALKLRTQIKDVAEIESVRIDSHGAAVDIIGSEPEKWHPTTRETADHSLPYIVAAALADGEITERQFTTERLSDRKLIDFVQRVEVRRHEELSAAYPTAVGNILTIQLRTGRALTERVDYPRVHARNPLTDSEVEAKFHSLADPIIGAGQGKKICGAVWKLDQAENLKDVLSLIRIRA